MTQYDNTDRGAVFPPRENEKMILKGQANNDGEDIRLVYTMSVTKDGKKIIDVYQKVGTLFPNDKKKEASPDYTGPFGNRRIACWNKEKDGMRYMSLTFSDKKSEGGTTKAIDDSIPF